MSYSHIGPSIDHTAGQVVRNLFPMSNGQSLSPTNFNVWDALANQGLANTSDLLKITSPLPLNATEHIAPLHPSVLHPNPFSRIPAQDSFHYRPTGLPEAHWWGDTFAVGKPSSSAISDLFVPGNSPIPQTAINNEFSTRNLADYTPSVNSPPQHRNHFWQKWFKPKA